jgi:hypothetical protein
MVNSCKKNNPAMINNVNSGNRVRTAVDSPKVFAGFDLTIMSPEDVVLLSALCTDESNDIEKIEWSKISGPENYNIETKSRLDTKVTGLKEGTYQFEIKIVDAAGRAAKDTVNVFVLKAEALNSNEVIFRKIEWIFPWYNALEVQNLYSHIPANVPMEVFVRRGFSNTWIEVKPFLTGDHENLYEYFIETRPDGAGIYNYGSLYIFYYGRDTDDKPDLKIKIY